MSKSDTLLGNRYRTDTETDVFPTLGTGGGGPQVNKFEQVSTLGHQVLLALGGVLYSEVPCPEKAVINSSTGTIPEERKNPFSHEWEGTDEQPSEIK